MKTHIKQNNSQYFFHQYLVDQKNLKSQKKKITQHENQDQMIYSFVQLGSSATSLHRCRLVQIAQENIQQWPMYLLKRISYFNNQKNKKNKTNQQFYDQNIKKLSQIKTQYLCYHIMSNSHRVVRMIQFINENPLNKQDNKFFYQFLNRKKQTNINACFILEFCNNGNLQDIINNPNNSLNQDDIVLYCCQILQGLIQIKKKGILHRDLRPCNIFLHNNQVKFGDFDSAFIYKQSQCATIKNGIDINTTPQQIVQLASLSDQQLEKIGNIKLYQLQSKCDIYFFGMIIFQMVFRRQYQKQFQGTDIQYLVREKINENFKYPKLLQIMKMCLYANVQKRIDLVTLYEQFKIIQLNQYFANPDVQRTYLSDQPLDLFGYRSVQNNQLEITKQIQNSIRNTFTISFASVQYNFEQDLEKCTFYRSTRIYQDEVNRILTKNLQLRKNNMWSISNEKKQKASNFLLIMEDFIVSFSIRAYFYDYLYKVILKINTKSIEKRQQKQIMISNLNIIQKQLIIILKFVFEILGRTPFKFDNFYDQKNLPYETRRLFRDKIKINNKINFFNGRAKTFKVQQYETYKMIMNFYSIDYDQTDNQCFNKIYHNLILLMKSLDRKMKCLLMKTIIDLFRPYQSSKNTQLSHIKQILFIMITLEKQNLERLTKCEIVAIKKLLQPLFSGQVCLDLQQAEIFFQNYKKIHQKQVQQSRKKQNIQLSLNLLASQKLQGLANLLLLGKKNEQKTLQIQDKENICLDDISPSKRSKPETKKKMKSCKQILDENPHNMMKMNESLFKDTEDLNQNCQQQFKQSLYDE